MNKKPLNDHFGHPYQCGRSLRLPDEVVLSLDRPVIMGVLNVTPDSFSDGGQYLDPDAAVEHGLAMAAAGAAVIDVGGESTRPGATPIAAQEQVRRVVDVIRKLRHCLDQIPSKVAISIDTTLSSVASLALDAGASMLNDVSAGREDPEIFGLAACTGAPIVLMHMQNDPASMQNDPRYDDVVATVESFLLERIDAALEAGVRREQILIDPGIGFGKTTAHNLTLLAHLDRFVKMGFPVLLGTSRKRFMREICQWGCHTLAPEDSDTATCSTTALGVAAGAAIFRVHNVEANRQAAELAWAILQAQDS